MSTLELASPKPSKAVSLTTPLPAPTDAEMVAVIKSGNGDMLKQYLDFKREAWAFKMEEQRFASLVAFNEAFCDAKAEIPVIIKNRNVRFESSKAPGGFVDYDHEDLAGIAEVIDPILAKHGLSYRWDTKDLEGGRFEVTCFLLHRAGHFEKVSQSGSRDMSGAKNDFQGRSSAETYLKRGTLKAVTGLAVGERDDDGRAAGNLVVSNGAVSAEQLAELNRLADELSIKKPGFCTVMKVTSLADIRSSDFTTAIALMETKRKGAK